MPFFWVFTMMRKSTITAKPAKRKRSRIRVPQDEAVIAALNDLNRMAPVLGKGAQAIALLKSWLKDDSGYDEQAWPKLKKSLDQQRAKVGARRLFDE